MVTRRKKIDGIAMERTPRLDTYCGECFKMGLREFQHETPGGPSCKFGHGGAPGVSPDGGLGLAQEPAECSHTGTFTSLGDGFARCDACGDCTFPESAAVAFEVRQGDTLTIKFDGASLQLAQYNNVQIDSAVYTRTLQDGDDLDHEFDRIYSFLKGQVMGRTKVKLQEFAEELRKAKARVRS